MIDGVYLTTAVFVPAFIPSTTVPLVSLESNTSAIDNIARAGAGFRDGFSVTSAGGGGGGGGVGSAHGGVCRCSMCIDKTLRWLAN